jgi:hypothetical protein
LPVTVPVIGKVVAEMVEPERSTTCASTIVPAVPAPDAGPKATTLPPPSTSIVPR